MSPTSILISYNFGWSGPESIFVFSGLILLFKLSQNYQLW